MRMELTPNFTLTSGRTVTHRYMPNDAQEVTVLGETAGELTEAEWSEYCDRLRAFRDLPKTERQRLSQLTQIEQVRASHQNVPRQVGDRRAVIVATEYEPGKFTHGVQFWTLNQVQLGVSINCDPGRTLSTMLAYL